MYVYYKSQTIKKFLHVTKRIYFLNHCFCWIMKFTTLIMVSFLLVFFILNDVNGAWYVIFFFWFWLVITRQRKRIWYTIELFYIYWWYEITEVNAKVCIKSKNYDENCGWDGNKTCIRRFKKINKHPTSCECTHENPNVNSKSICKCKFPKSPC